MNGLSRSDISGVIIKLIIANVIVYLVQIFSELQQMPYAIDSFTGRASVITYYFGLTPALITAKGYVWQFVSYMFLHSTGSFFHIFFNMYALLIFGMPIEQEWGSGRFLFYYFFCGTGAGVAIFTINYISGGLGYFVPTIGASGAVFGLLLAFGMLYPNAELLLFFFLPIKAKYLVFLYGALELYLELFGGSSSISHVGHLGGLFFGIVYFLVTRRRLISFKRRITQARMQKKLNQYDSLAQATPNYSAARDREEKLAILRRVREQGIHALTDDEFQMIRYLDIMTEDSADGCPDRLDESNRCATCKDFDACFLREIKRYW